MDGSVDTTTNRAGCGGVIRDPVGHSRGGLVHNIGLCSPFQAESWALLKGLQLAVSLGFKSLIVKSDSRLVVDQITNTHDEDGMASNILWVCKQITRQLDDVRFEVIQREKNNVADGLAKLAKQFPQGVHTFSNPPGEVMRLLDDDLVGIPQWRFVSSTNSS